MEDIAWAPKGEYLFSVGVDQTTRIHAEWVSDNRKEKIIHELSRPQIHGYDITSIAVLSQYKFVSGSEEKIARVFQAPKYFAENLQKVCGLQVDKSNVTELIESKGAVVPALGLSNKALIEENCNDINNMNKDAENFSISLEMEEPPTEEILVHTLWPEVQKLYGHGYEIFALAARFDGKVLASSCKATNSEHAAILLWDSSMWKHYQKLVSHQLTVTQMALFPQWVSPTFCIKR